MGLLASIQRAIKDAAESGDSITQGVLAEIVGGTIGGTGWLAGEAGDWVARQLGFESLADYPIGGAGASTILQGVEDFGGEVEDWFYDQAADPSMAKVGRDAGIAFDLATGGAGLIDNFRHARHLRKLRGPKRFHQGRLNLPDDYHRAPGTTTTAPGSPPKAEDVFTSREVPAQSPGPPRAGSKYSNEEMDYIITQAEKHGLTIEEAIYTYEKTGRVTEFDFVADIEPGEEIAEGMRRQYDPRTGEVYDEAGDLIAEPVSEIYDDTADFARRDAEEAADRVAGEIAAKIPDSDKQHILATAEQYGLEVGEVHELYLDAGGDVDLMYEAVEARYPRPADDLPEGEVGDIMDQFTTSESTARDWQASGEDPSDIFSRREGAQSKLRSAYARAGIDPGGGRESTFIGEIIDRLPEYAATELADEIDYILAQGLDEVATERAIDDALDRLMDRLPGGREHLDRVTAEYNEGMDEILAWDDSNAGQMPDGQAMAEDLVIPPDYTPDDHDVIKYYMDEYDLSLEDAVKRHEGTGRANPDDEGINAFLEKIDDGELNEFGWKTDQDPRASQADDYRLDTPVEEWAPEDVFESLADEIVESELRPQSMGQDEMNLILDGMDEAERAAVQRRLMEENVTISEALEPYKHRAEEALTMRQGAEVEFDRFKRLNEKNERLINHIAETQGISREEAARITHDMTAAEIEFIWSETGLILPDDVPHAIESITPSGTDVAGKTPKFGSEIPQPLSERNAWHEADKIMSEVFSEQEDLVPAMDRIASYLQANPELREAFLSGDITESELIQLVTNWLEANVARRPHPFVPLDN